MNHKAFNKFMIEIINEEISNFNNTKFTDVPDELFQKLKLRKFSDDANKSHMKLFKAKDGNNFLVKKIINEDIFKVYNLEDFQNPIATAVYDVHNDYFTGYEHQQSIQVKPEYKRIGIATAITDFAENIYKLPYKPTKLLTPDMQKFADKRFADNTNNPITELFNPYKNTNDILNEIEKNLKELLKENILEKLNEDTAYNFTEEDIDNCWQYYKSYLVDILNGEYDLNTAREDLQSLIGSEFDKRTKKTINEQPLNEKVNSFLNEEDYRGEHQAPNKNDSPMYDVTNAFSSDIYGSNALRMFGGYNSYDNYSIAIIQQAKNKPNKQIKIYRAVPAVVTNQEKINDYEKRMKEIQRRGKLPRDVTNWQNASEYYNWLDSEVEKLKTQPSDTTEKIKINNGDWVTINPMYAKEHGQNNLNNKYKVITKTVNAKNLFTDGNSVHEWGYVENLNEGVDKIKSGKKLYYHGRKMG